MKKINLILSIMIAMLIFSSNLFSQDWPQFRGINRDSKVTGFKAPATWPDSLKIQWKVKVGTGDATPILVGKKVYLHTRQEADEVILCLDAATGKALWADKYPAPPVTGPAGSHPGPRSTPAFADGKIVTFGTSGILSCLDAATGKVIWRHENPINAIPQFFTGMSPLIVDGICIAHVGTKDNGNVIALDLKTGNEKWNWKGDGPAYASPSLMVLAGKKHIIVQTEKNLMALDFTDGTMLWQVQTIVQSRFYNCVSPYINANKIYYTGQGTGTKAIEVIKEGDKYVTKELWSTSEIGAKWNTPVFKGGYLYGFTDQRKIYCLNAADGKTAWIDALTHSDFATIVDCGQVLIGFAQTGNLIVFKPDAAAYTEVVKYKVTNTPVYTFPIVAGNLVYIKDAENLILYKIE
jgi:outer membrane protein assembly factor BamB